MALLHSLSVRPLHLLKHNDLGADRVYQIRAIVDAMFHSFLDFLESSAYAIMNFMISSMIFLSASNSVKGVVHLFATGTCHDSWRQS